MGKYKWYQIKELIKCQKRIIRNITNSNFIDHTKPLFKKINCLNINDINTLETLKIIHDTQYGTLPSSLFEGNIKNVDIHNHDTRQKNNFHLKSRKLDITKSNSVLYRGRNIWNNLLVSEKNILSKQKFISCIKKKLINQY